MIIHAILPARDEAAMLPRTLPALLAQRLPPGAEFRVTLVDDHSSDGTGDLARRLGASSGRLTVLCGAALPPGWTGKLWAMEQGVRHSGASPADWLWFTDADIAHDPGALSRLIARADAEERDLVSEMVELRCESEWERLMIPAFVFFFGVLYPFQRVNDPDSRAAGAAGGSILVRAGALEAAGGLSSLRGEIIDDCALAARVKQAGGRLWLGHSEGSRSLREYEGLGEIWRMVARTAFAQLRHSPWLLAGTVAAMAAAFFAPTAALQRGIRGRRWGIAAAGLAGILSPALTYLPTIRRFRLASWRALTLPLASALFTAMTIDSARRHWLGRGGEWKGRTHGQHLP